MFILGRDLMLGRVNYITKNLYQEPGPYDNIEGSDFENQMHHLISNEIQRYYTQGLKLKRTPTTRDDGKDMIITSPVKFILFGQEFKHKNRKEEITVYIECKSTKDSRVDRDKFSHNILVANDSNIDYFVLATNKCITPEAYYMAMCNAKKNNYEFILFDKITLNIFTKNYVPSSQETISYQIMTGIENGENRLDIFLLFQNHSSQKQLFKYNLKSNRNWKLSKEALNKFIEPYSCIAVRITAVKEYNDGINDLLLNIEYDNNAKIVSISGSNVDYVFETPLVGQQHKDLINVLSDKILNNFQKTFVHIHGEAGIEKTRIKDEIIKRIQNCGIDILEYRCIENKQNNDKEEFIALLKEKGIKNNLDEQYSRYVVILEDFHYASRCLIDYIIKCSAPTEMFSMPVSFLVIGRSDDTIYNKEYIRFTKYTQSSQYILEKEIHKLTLTDCMALVEIIIKEVPQKVLIDICYAAENNPFYIIQFIEYLLENKLVNIANRNTVGIINADSFKKKIYIPRSIEELLEKRINLLKEQTGIQAYYFLLILAFKKNICDTKLFDEWFSVDENAKTYLLQHHFVKNDSYGENVIFEHENIYRYCTKLISINDYSNEIFKKIYETKFIFDSLNIFEKGKIYYQNALYDEAIDSYEEIINQIQLFDNVAAINLPFYYLEYIDDIYNISLKKRDYELCEKSILSVLYISLHNIANGYANQNIDNVEKRIRENHRNNHKLQISYKQMKMHYYMQCGNNLKALQLGSELLAIEQNTSDLFRADVRFNLFDRLSSLYNQLNHKELAENYNQLAFNVAINEKNDALYALSYMTASKICFFCEIKKSLEYMQTAQEYISCAKNIRLGCHNTLSIISAELLSDTNTDKTDLLQAVTEQLNIANEIQYPIAQIRSYYLMAVLLYTQLPKVTHWDLIVSYLDKAIELCIYNSSIKLLPNIYNLKAIVAHNLNENTDLIFKYYNTMLLYLKHQNQLFLGNFDFTYSNIINLTNYALFLLYNNSENEYYNFMSQISGYDVDVFCDFKCSDSKLCFYSCTNALDKFIRIKQELLKRKFINGFDASSYNLMDISGEYYIPLLV